MQCETIWPSQFSSAAEMLVQAANLAESAGRTRWDFAVEIEELQRIGLARSQLRWLVCQGFVEHKDEVAEGPIGHRRFRSTNTLSFSCTTCFVLSEQAGLAALNASIPPTNVACNQQCDDRLPLDANGHRNASTHGRIAVKKPTWNGDLQRLFVGDLIVKEFRRPAPNQQLVLAAFEEDGWPPRIDDPLPPAPRLVPKRRLSETISALNRHQRNPLLRFSADGRGLGVIWSLTEHAR